tara:strand:+ start:103 stop:726 length:624 start_codon:yes stop_codon:yes gene_type:complete
MNINGKPFIDILIKYLCTHGFRRFIISVGYRKEKIIEHFKYYKKCEIIFSEENKQLGTGGAIKHAKKYIQSEKFFVTNGDSYITLDFFDLYQSHLKKNSFITIAGIKTKASFDVGLINIDSNNRILSFKEKSLSDENHNYTNTGIYLFNYEVFNTFPTKLAFSIETDYFEKLDNVDFHLYQLNSVLYDIGTPKKLLVFQKYIKSKYG